MKLIQLIGDLTVTKSTQPFVRQHAERDALPNPDNTRCVERLIGDRITARRVELALTLPDLSVRTQIPLDRLLSGELGKTSFSVQELFRLSRTMNVKVSHFFKDVDPGANESKNTDALIRMGSINSARDNA